MATTSDQFVEHVRQPFYNDIERQIDKTIDSDVIVGATDGAYIMECHCRVPGMDENAVRFEVEMLYGR